MLLHRILVYSSTFLLCLSLCSTSRQALHPNAEVQVSVDDETMPPQQGRAVRTIAATHGDVTTGEPPREEPVTRHASRQHKEHLTPPAWGKNGYEEPLQLNMTLQSNTTQKPPEQFHDKATIREGKQKKQTQNILDTPVWLTQTLNVTVTPRVTWTRRPPCPSQEEEMAKGSDFEEDEDILLTVTFITEGQPLVLDLHPNRDLLTADYTESSDVETNEDDTPPREDLAPPCEYQGVVRGVEETWAALSVCGGLRGVVAVTLDGDQQVELLVEPSAGSKSSREPHTVFSAALLSLSDGACGVKAAASEAMEEKISGESPAAEINTSSSSSHRRRRWEGLTGGPLWYKSTTRFVELVVVADHSFFIKHGKNTRSRCKTLVNIVNALYRPLGVVVVLSNLQVWKHGDKMPVTADYEANLKHFKEYRKNLIKEKPDYNNDNTMLLTTVDFTGNTVGYAVVSGMCSITGSTGVVQDKQQHVGVTAFTLAHEMGHNFGMSHDEELERSCHCKSCVMSGLSSSKFNAHASWSSCSRRVVEQNLDSVSYACLRNVPTRMYRSSSCGDGVVDAGEQCDCGPAEFCDNPCCVAATCTLAVSASCASGPCCNTKTCQLKPVGTACREAFTECDLPEYCSGASEACPEDVTKGDGAPCRGGEGHCFNAKCGTHEDQCRRVWGQDATVADDACYYKLNKRGGSNGNCGFKGQSNVHLLPCADGDELCGSLQCFTDPDTKPGQIGAAFKYGTFSFGRFSCSYIVSSESLPMSYWLTPDGAKCGKNKMCKKQKCVRVPEPSGHCRGGCSGHGVCNNRNHCHCDPGFAPPDCSREGSGGSIDSSKIGRNRYKDPLWEAIFIASLILLGIATVICCLWAHIRRWWEAGARDKTCPCCGSCLDICCCAPMSLITDRLCATKRKEDVSKEAQYQHERDKMVCQVDLDFTDKQPKTQSWGVASQRLVTEVTTMTPKNSQDYKRKILLPSTHSTSHPTTTEDPDRPTYLQSISVDSGCVSDAEDIVVRESCGSQISLKRLLSVVKISNSQSSSPAKDDNTPSKPSKRQPSMQLSRFVVDPLAGSGRSRQGTPPPDHVRLDCRRSISVDDAKTNASSRPRVAPPPLPPPTEKPSKSIIVSAKTCRSTEHSVPTPWVTHANDSGQGNSPLKGKIPLRPFLVKARPASPSSTPSHQTQARKPMMPPRKPMMPPNKKDITSIARQTQLTNDSSPTNNSSSKLTQVQVRGPPKRPILPPSNRPPKLSGSGTCGSSKQRADGEVPHPSKAGGRVKDMAEKLEKR